MKPRLVYLPLAVVVLEDVDNSRLEQVAMDHAGDVALIPADHVGAALLGILAVWIKAENSSGHFHETGKTLAYLVSSLNQCLLGCALVVSLLEVRWLVKPQDLHGAAVNLLQDLVCPVVFCHSSADNLRMLGEHPRFFRPRPVKLGIVFKGKVMMLWHLLPVPLPCGAAGTRGRPLRQSPGRSCRQHSCSSCWPSRAAIPYWPSSATSSRGR